MGMIRYRYCCGFLKARPVFPVNPVPFPPVGSSVPPVIPGLPVGTFNFFNFPRTGLRTHACLANTHTRTGSLRAFSRRTHCRLSVRVGNAETPRRCFQFPTQRSSHKPQSTGGSAKWTSRGNGISRRVCGIWDFLRFLMHFPRGRNRN